MAESKEAAGLRALLRGLVTYVVDFTVNGPDSNAVDLLHDRTEAPLELANVVSSRIPGTDNHVLAIDIDHPSWLVKSSTEDHFHLYVKVPEGIPTEPYMRLLDALAECRVVEEGYARVSRRRGFTSLRLPWVKKTTAIAVGPSPSQASGPVTPAILPEIRVPRGGVMFDELRRKGDRRSGRVYQNTVQAMARDEIRREALRRRDTF